MKSFAVSSQLSSPLVATISSESVLRCSLHHATSRWTQTESAAAGDASRTKYRETSSARSIIGHSSGLAARLVVSRNTRSARRLCQGLPSDPSAACSCGASRPSAAWL